MVIKFGRFGQFLACSNYPECRTTREVAKPAADGDGAAAGSQAGADGAAEEVAETCELCGKPMALKRGRFGPFLGCTGYPECRNIRKIEARPARSRPRPCRIEGETCPVDGAQLVRRHGRFGEFISCSNYPTCNYIKRETTGVACPKPGCKGEIVVKKSKRGKVLLRLLGVSEVRHGLLGQARRRAVPAMQRAVHAGEDDEEGRHDPLLRARGVRPQGGRARDVRAAAGFETRARRRPRGKLKH